LYQNPEDIQESDPYTVLTPHPDFLEE